MVDLAADFSQFARLADPRRWLTSLIDTTERRAAEEDELFFEARGPHSEELERWLESNVEEYDVVLVHGTPFSSFVTGTTIARSKGVPTVLLPHYHLEDRYYHWRCYYDAFRSADAVIAAPDSTKSLFFDPIGARSVTAPGGGVEPDEFSPVNLEHGKAEFKALHRPRRPFVLVLGRKAGGKNYRQVVDAVSELGRRQEDVDLVLIGPDDDGQQIAVPNVYYYGPQPRSVVVGALASALCLVNMSESESFGIVLIESWLAGRPVIAQQRCLAFCDLVVDASNGWLVDSVPQLIDRVSYYLRNASIADDHGRAGADLARRYSWDAVSARIREVLLACAKSRENLQASHV